ncbi:MAG: hypothetical protein IPL63_14265 [Saprospiraceae bacterium]|nr:hypothetical protein [Saprospiraceae bacterium]MBK6783193.1 hypothetical protein [Saprospiraceae bacterium]MBK8548485.1 hypothetical protein [Saprospiraceae bacterium]MBK9043478.1 hypothetical protein [Saprospiraceae bacterium]MBP6695396.1 hypothetical protein [Saprospiraceae bacterium]
MVPFSPDDYREGKTSGIKFDFIMKEPQTMAYWGRDLMYTPGGTWGYWYSILSGLHGQVWFKANNIRKICSLRFVQKFFPHFGPAR